MRFRKKNNKDHGLSYRICRKMGLTSDQSGIIRRYYREKEGWDHHLNHTKKFIEKSLQHVKPKKLAIYGSGWLLDVPIEYLLKYTEKVYLYDISHPKQIRLKYKGNDNLHFIEDDITGGAIEACYYWTKEKKAPVKPLLDTLENTRFQPPDDIDFMVSLNVLSQLGSLITDYIKQKKRISNWEAKKIDQRIQQNHIELLKNMPSCLITDHAEIKHPKYKNSTENSILAIDLPKNATAQEWLWRFDHSYRYYHDANVDLKVWAINF